MSSCNSVLMVTHIPLPLWSTYCTLPGEVGGVLVVEEDLVVEGPGSPRRSQPQQRRPVVWKGRPLVHLIRRHHKRTPATQSMSLRTFLCDTNTCKGYLFLYPNVDFFFSSYTCTGTNISQRYIFFFFINWREIFFTLYRIVITHLILCENFIYIRVSVPFRQSSFIFMYIYWT